MALNNAGTINASDVQFKIANCTVTDNHLVTSSTVVFGTAPTCSDMWTTIQEMNSAFTTNTYCAFGATTTPPACDAPSAANSLGTATSLTNLKTTGGVTATLNSGTTRYYKITITPNTGLAGNVLQNRKVSFDMTWHIDQ